MNPLFAQLGAGPQALAAARAGDLDALTPADLARATRLVQAVLRAAQALELALLAAADRKGAHRAPSEPSLPALGARGGFVRWPRASRTPPPARWSLRPRS